MVECYLEAKLNKCISEKNPFYGKLVRKTLIRDENEIEKDEREDIAPFGIEIRGTIGGTYLELKVSRHYLISDYEGWYYATFSDENLVYRIDVYIDEKGVDPESTYVTTQFAEDYMEGNDNIKDKIYGNEFLFVDKFIS